MANIDQQSTADIPPAHADDHAGQAPPADPNAAPSTEPSPNAPEQQPPPPPEQQPQQAQVVNNVNLPAIKPVPFYPTDTGEMYRYAQWVSKSELIPKALRGKPNDVLLVMLKGHDLGLKPMQSIATINCIDGKAEIGALLMVSLILKSGLCEYWQLVHSDAKSARYRTKRLGAPEVVFEYTIEEADQMGLLDKGRTDWAKENNQWKKQPRTMLRRRAQSNLAREVFPDIVLGMYDHDELQEMRDREIAMGLDPDRIIPVVDATTADGLAAVPPNMQPATTVVDPPQQHALPAPVERTIPLELVPPTPREPVKKQDPLKARLQKRGQQQIDGMEADEAPCAMCGVPILGKPGDKCDACTRSL